MQSINHFLNHSDALIDEKQYETMYQLSIQAPERFWAMQAKKYLTWFRDWDTVLSGSFAENNVRWFSGARLNVCYNCVDRHLPQLANQAAIIWQGDEPDQSRIITYDELHAEVCRLANGLKELGLKKGDRVCIYLPMLPEAAIAMLACARIGVVHSVVFAGFSPTALKNRIVDAACSAIITADINRRGGKIIPLKANVDAIIAECPTIQKVIVLNTTGQNVRLNQYEIDYHTLVKAQSCECAIEEMEASDPLFILYTSGSTGKPKGILHGQAGYLLYVTMTFQLIFNYQPKEVYWSTADVGWITGHSYIVYGPLASGATTLIFAGMPTYPTPSRYWEIIDKHRVNIFYTAPTAIRALMALGEQPVQSTRRDSLRILGSVGEPINPDVWLWYYNIVGEKRCPIVDTWWQTETGGIMICPFPYATPLKPGSACKPFFGVAPAIMDEEGHLLKNPARGNLVITQPWPGQLQTIYGAAERCRQAYFVTYSGMYFTGDGVSCDKDGYYWIIGRVDDVINVSGHRLGTAEIENILVSHPKVAEAAVVGYPHKIKGQGIIAFVTPKKGIEPDAVLFSDLIHLVSEKISPIAKPDKIIWTEDLPKTRSGKIMRRILNKIVNNQKEDLGDISTLSNPEIVNAIIEKLSI